MNHATTLILSTALMMPVGAATASPTSEITALPNVGSASNLVVDVDATVPNASTVHRRVDASARGAFADVKRSWSDGERVLVHVSGEQYEYSIRISATRLDVTLEESTVGCECNTAELSERVSAEVTRVAARFSETTASPEVTPQREPTQAEPTAEAKPPTMVLPEARPRKPALVPAKRAPTATLGPVARTPAPVVAVHESRRIRVAGIVTLVAGSALLFAGAGMMAAGSTELLDRWRHYQRDWRPLGFTVGGVGVASIGIGGSLMLFEELRCRRRPDSCASRRQYAKHIEHSPTKGTNR